MMTLRPTILALAGAIAAPAAASAQPLPEALALAYAYNPTLLTARAQLRAVDENVPQALAGWRPSVTISSSIGWTDSQARQPAFQTNPFTGEVRAVGTNITGPIDTSRTIGTGSVIITQPVFRGGRTVASTRRAENQVYGQRARLLATEQQVLGDTVNAYVAVIRDQELLRLNINNEQVLTEQLRATNERFRVGEITRTDVAQAESRLAGAIAQRVQAEGNLQISRATFQREVGTVPQRLVAPQPLGVPVRDAREASAIAGDNNPNVVAALFDEAAARDFIAVQLSALLPQVSVQGQAFRSDNTQLPHTRQTGTQITATLTVPLYQGGAEYSVVRQARQTAQQARWVVDDQRRQAVQLASQAWEQLQASRAQVDSVRAQIRAAEIALDGVQREAIVGSRTTLDVLNAEQELLNARTSLVQALATLVSQSYALASSIGRLTATDLALPVETYDVTTYYREVRNRWFGLGNYTPPPVTPTGVVAPSLEPPEAR
ncbi:MAG TPA: TolC family outer membrane protein [Crenalkalicoccus sp.]|jgi:outer membrane protein|nr:TolC family outer membrane protein [Crenalkalicoccus sp.]